MGSSFEELIMTKTTVKTVFTLDARFKSYGFSKFGMVCMIVTSSILTLYGYASVSHANINPRRFRQVAGHTNKERRFAASFRQDACARKSEKRTRTRNQLGYIYLYSLPNNNKEKVASPKMFIQLSL